MKKLIIVLLVLLIGVTGCGENKEKRENQEAYRRIGMNCMAEGNYEAAVDAFQKALDQSLARVGEIEVDTCYYKAEAQYLAGRTSDAIATYTALIEYDDENAKAYYLRGSLCMAEGIREDAVKDFEQAAKYAGDDYAIPVGIAKQMSQAGDSAEAERYLKRALDIGGKSASSYTWRGRIYLMRKDYENAKKELKKALKKESTEASLYLGQLYEATGESAKAEECYSSYVESHAGDTLALESLAELAFQKEDYDKAVSYLKLALETDNPVNEQSLRRKLIQAYEFSADFAKAKEQAQSYTGDYPDDEEAAREYVFLQTR